MVSLELLKRSTCYYQNGIKYCSGIYRRGFWHDYGNAILATLITFGGVFLLVFGTILLCFCIDKNRSERPADTIELLELQDTEQDPQLFQPVPQQQFSHPYQQGSAPPGLPPPEYVAAILVLYCIVADRYGRHTDTTQHICPQEAQQDPQIFQPVPQQQFSQQFSHPYQHESAPPRGPPPPEYFSGQSYGNQGAAGGYHNPAGSANPGKDYAPPPDPSSAA